MHQLTQTADMNKPSYRVLKGKEIDELEVLVDEMLSEGYILTGGVFFDLFNRIYIQAVYLPEALERHPIKPLSFKRAKEDS